MVLFKKKPSPTPPPQRPATSAPTTGPVEQASAQNAEQKLREKIAELEPAIDTFVSGDFRDASVTVTIVDALDASMAPRFFPDQSIWAKSIPFAHRAAAINEWMIVVKLYQLCEYWNDDALPQLRQSSPQFCDMLGWARAEDRSKLRDMAFAAAQQLDPSRVVFSRNGETVGNILLVESSRLGRAVDWLASPVPPPPPPPTTREKIDAVIARARAGDADAIMYEKALAAETDEESRQFLEQAAALGSVDAMEAAAEMSAAAGDAHAEAFWAETAANAGSTKGMMRIMAIHYNAGRIAEAATWLEKAGQAGDATGYLLLAKIALESGDHATAHRWAEIGAAAGEAECLRLKGSFILNEGGMDNAFKAHTWFVESARRGNAQAMYQAGLLAELFGNAAQSTYWFSHAASLGHVEAQQRLGQRD